MPRQSGIIHIILMFVIAAVLIIGAVIFLTKDKLTTTQAPSNKPTVLIGFSLGTLQEERWATDRDFFVERAKQLGALVNVEEANSDPDRQLTQIENLINQGVKTIVIVPQDGEKAKKIVEEAHKAGIKIIAYDRLIKETDLDLYVSFDSVKVGEMEAQGVLSKVGKGNFALIGGSATDNNAFLVKQGMMNVLDPKIKNGEIKIVLDTFIDNWKPELAYKTIKDYLASVKTLDAVVIANDGMAFGVTQALKENGLDGKIPISGQDAELTACQRIIQGTQAVTVYKPLKSLAYKAAELAVALASGGNVDTNSITNNGKIDVPSYLIQPIAVTKDNMMDTVIKDNFHTYNEVYQVSSK